LITGGSERIGIESDGKISFKSSNVGIATSGIGSNTEKLFIQSDSGQSPLKVKANTVDALFIDSDGKVGVGTISPLYNFQIKQTGNSPAMMIGGAYYGNPRLQVYGLDADLNAWMGLGTDMGGGPYELSIYTSNYSGMGKISFGTYNGTIYNQKMVMLNNGNFGIGTLNPQDKLHVNGSIFLPAGTSLWIGNNSDYGNRTRIHHANGNTYIDFATGSIYFRSGTTSVVTFSPTGNVYANAFYYTSDRAKKENITNIDGALDLVKKMQGVGFNFKDDEAKTHKVGFIAQDMELVLPEVVHGENGSMTVDYASVSAVLVEAVKELDAVSLERYKKQQEEIEDLREEMESLRKEVEALKKG
jgi:hypothetical protein